MFGRPIFRSHPRRAHNNICSGYPNIITAHRYAAAANADQSAHSHPHPCRAYGNICPPYSNVITVHRYAAAANADHSAHRGGYPHAPITDIDLAPVAIPANG